MRGAALLVVASIAVGSACGSTGEAQPQSVLPPASGAADNPLPTSTSAAPQASLPPPSEVIDTVVTVAASEPTIYRPAPIREGTEVTAMIVPIEGVVLADSSVSFQIVELPDGRFLEEDLTNAVVPERAIFWTTRINGGALHKTTAHQGSTIGIRVDQAMYGESFLVTFSAITTDGEVLATTGDVEIGPG